MRAWRRGMIVAIAVAAAVLTPSQDPFTFLAMGLPLYALYEGCIVIARLRERATRRRRAPGGANPGAQSLEQDRLGDDVDLLRGRGPALSDRRSGRSARRSLNR